MKGLLLKGIAGFYYVLSDGIIYECKARGKFRSQKTTPIVGDYLELSEDTKSIASDSSMKAGVIEKLLPRKNQFDRPPIANVDICLIVSAIANPKPLTYIIDRMIVSAELLNCEPVIVLNKADLADTKEIADIYKDIYKVFCVSTKTGEGIEKLKAYLYGKTAALCGPSGVGKSSLSNSLLDVSHIETGEISQKTLRGKNTTRHSELFKGDGFFLFDTPGFTSFDAPELDENTLDMYFPEFDKLRGKCRFDNCKHLSEPDCAIKNALSDKKISESRYISYTQIYNEIKERRKF